MRDGKRLHHRLFTVHYQANQSGQARLGIAVGRRVSRLATRRNLIKRIVRESFRRESERLPEFDLVFNVRTPAAEATRLEFAHAVRGVLHQISSRTANSVDQEHNRN